MINKSALLFSAYLPPIQYFSKLMLHEHIIIEQHEHYQKQTYRNRCNIQTSNGILTLTIPVRNSNKQNQAIKDIAISYDEDWQRLHWRSICTAYRCSPFFEFYEDSFAPFYEQKRRFLFDYNLELLQTVCKCLKINLNFDLTTAYEKVNVTADDYREIITPKTHKTAVDVSFSSKPYSQVFSDKLGFMPNLSILDLLCNEGPHSISYLNDCIKC